MTGLNKDFVNRLNIISESASDTRSDVWPDGEIHTDLIHKLVNVSVHLKSTLSVHYHPVIP